jgi:hypothetical protein
VYNSDRAHDAEKFAALSGLYWENARLLIRCATALRQAIAQGLSDKSGTDQLPPLFHLNVIKI